jgi:hypothetical protein
MTLRVTLEIIPHGDEIRKYSLGSIEIHNTGDIGLGLCAYHAQQFSDGDTILKETVDGTLEHSRQEGPWVLVKKAIESLKI